VRKAVVVAAVAAALIGVAAAARPAWGLFSSSAVSAQSVKAAALPAPSPVVAGRVWVGGDAGVDALAGSPTASLLRVFPFRFASFGAESGARSG
jgi:hypothetical protein